MSFNINLEKPYSWAELEISRENLGMHLVGASVLLNIIEVLLKVFGFDHSSSHCFLSIVSDYLGRSMRFRILFSSKVI